MPPDPVQIDAALTGRENGVSRDIELGSTGDFGVDRTGAAKEETLALVLAALGAKLAPADIVALATAARQDQIKAVLDTILGAVDGLEAISTSQDTKLATISGRLPAALLDGGVRTREVEAPVRTQFEYDATGLVKAQIRYMGIAPQGTPDAGAWTVRRLTWQTVSGDDKPVDIQTLTGAWTDRAALPWS